jgi:hypothetical protein
LIGFEKIGVRGMAKLLTRLLMMILALAIAGSVASAQTSLPSEETLERQFTDPLSSLPQLIVRDSYTPANYGTDVQTNQLIVRPIIPRLPPYALLPVVQLVRPTFALVTVPSSRGGSRTEFGDIPLFDLALVPLDGLQKRGFLIGIGPAFIVPAATSRSAGQGAWQAGPALGAIYDGVPGLLVGFIAQNPVSFAYTSPSRPPQNTLEFQPVLALHLWGQWYLRSAEANWQMSWYHHGPTVLPLSIGLGRTFVSPDLPPMSLFITGQWTAYRQFAPVASQTTINFGLTVGFPGLKLW